MAVVARPRYGDSQYGSYAKIGVKLHYGLDLNEPKARIALSGYGKAVSAQQEQRLLIEKIRSYGEIIPTTDVRYSKELQAGEANLEKTEAATREQLQEKQKRVEALPPPVLKAVGEEIGVEAGAAIQFEERTVSDQLAAEGADTSKQDQQWLKQKNKEVEQLGEKFQKEETTLAKNFEKEIGIPKISEDNKVLGGVANKLEQQAQMLQGPTLSAASEPAKQEPGSFAPRSQSFDDNSSNIVQNP